MFEKNLEKTVEKGASGFVLLGPIFGYALHFPFAAHRDHDSSSGDS